MSNLSEPIGRKSIKEALKSLKVLVDLKRGIFLDSHQHFRKLMTKFFEIAKDDPMKLVTLQAHTYASDSMDLVQTEWAYIASLESYLSELDETFDKILEAAKKEAEKQIKEMPKEKPPFYG